MLRSGAARRAGTLWSHVPSCGTRVRAVLLVAALGALALFSPTRRGAGAAEQEEAAPAFWQSGRVDAMSFMQSHGLLAAAPLRPRQPARRARKHPPTPRARCQRPKRAVRGVRRRARNEATGEPSRGPARPLRR
jgi:hypothetical protein